jgi:hypothetical protein
MVLFYRQEESIASVADILRISEEAVRQRLSRGRAMLNERVAKVVELGLRRSGPTKALVLAVLAALPVASAKAGTLGAATSFDKCSAPRSSSRTNLAWGLLHGWEVYSPATVKRTRCWTHSKASWESNGSRNFSSSEVGTTRLHDSMFS